MADKILYIAVDVDDNKYTASYLSKDGSIKGDGRLDTSAEAIARFSKRFQQKGMTVRICYESTYLGFSLQRSLLKLGIHCDVVASSLIPVKPGDFTKTDRLDAKKLVEMYAAGLLTICHVPTSEEENVRDLVRVRKFIVSQISDFKKKITSFCRIKGLDYRSCMKNSRSHYWTKAHLNWLDVQIKEARDPNLAEALRLQLVHYERLISTLQEFDDAISEVARSEHYKKQVQGLSCYSGIQTLTAMTIITEVGDPLRFNHPNKLVGYCGMGIREYSSGGKEMKFSITKMGNSYLRTAVVEASQTALNRPRISKSLKQRRKDADTQDIAAADRCMKRLHKKGTRLLYRGKPRNKAIVACARELLCFVWETLTRIRKAEQFA